MIPYHSTAQLTEDFCGVEPVTHPPIEIETRPPPPIDEDKLRKAYHHVNSVLLGGLYHPHANAIRFLISENELTNLLLLCSYSGDIVLIAGDYGRFDWSLPQPTQRRIFDARGQGCRYLRRSRRGRCQFSDGPSSDEAKRMVHLNLLKAVHTFRIIIVDMNKKKSIQFSNSNRGNDIGHLHSMH